MRRRRPTAIELRIWMQLEGRPFPSAAVLSAELGVSKPAAWRLLSRLKRTGVMRAMNLVKRMPGTYECAAYLRARLTNPGAVADLERRLENDPVVTVAAKLTGSYDYRVVSMHRSVYIANDWFRDLLKDPAVTDGVLELMNTILDRPLYAAAIVGGEPHGD